MNKFLLDENLSPKTGNFLENTFGFDVLSVADMLPPGSADEKVVAAAIKDKRVIITFDLDFGEIYHFREQSRLGIIVLRLRDQTSPAVNNVLKKFFSADANTINLSNSLVILSENGIRIIGP